MKEECIIRRKLSDLRGDRTDWERVDAMREEEINEAALSDPDNPPTEYEFWKNAVLRMPQPKQSISLRVDQDVLEWFKSRGRGYQTLMNAVLRSYMEAQKKEAASEKRE